MKRREFTRTCIACLATPLIAPLIQGCQSVHYASGTIEKDGISVPLSEFSFEKDGQLRLREYLLVRNDALEFPIYVYRFSDSNYSAVLMKCTHQGTELQAAGDHLTCPAHGSEFNNRGGVEQGPADKNLRSFPVTVDSEKIFINLRS